jgi:uncharacterized protein (TIGR02301 family)
MAADRLAAPPREQHNRRMNRFGRLSMALALLISLAGVGLAQDAAPDATAGGPKKPAAGQDQPPPQATEPPAPIYDEKLLRLSEILGSLSFLRDLCGASDGPTWRDEMTALLGAEKPAPHRRARLIARFNHGFETFNAVYRTCTPSAELSIARYLSEGAALASDVRGRYNQ